MLLTIKSVELINFKSFKLANISFSAGFNAITGPNGSGKSNIVEAINFALGIRGSRALRAENVPQLIFNKGKARKARVTIVFEESRGEVRISREINRRGRSRYLLNGIRKTRTQIVDFLLKHNVQPGGHNIILQGDITKIIKMKPVERRAVIDEISGISEYEEKKGRALKKLEKVNMKLGEANLVLREKEIVFENLRKDLEALKMFSKLNRRKRELEDLLLITELNSLLKKQRSIQDKLNQGKISSYERKLRSIRGEIEEITIELEKFEDKLISKIDELEIENLKSAIRVKEAQIKANLSEIERLKILNEKAKPFIIQALKGLTGVYGPIKDLITPKKSFLKALTACAGQKLNSIVVRDFDTAKKCIEFLRTRKIGRASFIPLDTVKPRVLRSPPQGSMGIVKEYLDHEVEVEKAVDYVFGDTVLVKEINDVKREWIGKFRVVDLEGNLIERSGVVQGGYMKRGEERKRSMEMKMEKLLDENERLKGEILSLKGKLPEKHGKTVLDEKNRYFSLKRELKKLKHEEKYLIGKIEEEKSKGEELRIQEALLKTKINELTREIRDKRINMEGKTQLNREKLIKELSETEEELRNLGKINFKAEDEYKKLKRDVENLKLRVATLEREREKVISLIDEIERKKREVFFKTLLEVSKEFNAVFKELTNGRGWLRMEEKGNMDSGLIIEVEIPEKKVVNIDSLSGGEKTLTALAFILALQRHKPSPFYIFDEADEALDPVNCRKFSKLIRREASKTQFILTSLRKETLVEAQKIIGVTVNEGLSKVVEVEIK